MYNDVQELIRKLSSSIGHIIYISPSHFEQFVKHYKFIYHEQEEKFDELIARFSVGLNGIEKTEKQIEAIQE